jgi:hypothetical protein
MEVAMRATLLIPNSTQIPNVLLDLLCPLLRESEVRVLLYLCRRTYGFQRPSDHISLSQFVGGITRHGKPLDLGCGLGRSAVIEALAFLQRLGLVQRLAGGLGRTHISHYRLVLDCAFMEKLTLLQAAEEARKQMVHELDLFRKGPPTRPFPPEKGPPTRPEKVRQPDPQNQGKLRERNQGRARTREEEEGEEWVMHNAVYGLHRRCGALHQRGTPC